ncbi:hypothetical protein E2320_001920 [Naja naja]|nr:hypothetical protein E2320_001920 [Naja naja]
MVILSWIALGFYLQVFFCWALSQTSFVDSVFSISAAGFLDAETSLLKETLQGFRLHEVDALILNRVQDTA